MYDLLGDHRKHQANMEDLRCNIKWLFDEEKLRNTPSVVENGITPEQELTFRQKQAMLIQTIGLKSGLTQLAVNTSVIFMHRFYMFRSVKSFPRVHLALGLAFAGGKVEESARKLEHLIRTAVDIIRTNKNREFLDKTDPFTYEMDSQYRVKMEVLCQNNCNIESPAYQEMRKLVLYCEKEIYAVIDGYLSISAENIKDISQYAYNLATASSQLTMLCLKYTPETIAIMCLNIASKAHSVKFVSMKDPNVKWYQVLHSQTDIAAIEAVSEEFLQCIKGCPLLPSWMTNLGRMSRVANNRAMPGPARGPGVAFASTSQGARPSYAQPITSSAATASIPQPPVATALPPSNHSVKQLKLNNLEQ
ncbi:cyclin-T2-like [Physella acuta]|uniref:cyclin-T2-like n=1 Tax=Physella acuta TaxID=109671 RepID=UPI0027DCCAAF|nr:cyclin-T2-like [Physella acuta]